MLTRAFNVSRTTAASPLSDVVGLWYQNAADSAYTLGWTTGVSQGVFAGGENMTRAQLATAIARVLGLQNEPVSQLDIYSDRAQVPQFAIGPMAALVRAGLIGQNITSLRPNEGVSKVEAIVIVDRAVLHAASNTIDPLTVASQRFNVTLAQINEALNTGKNIVNGQLVTPQRQAPTGQVQRFSMTAQNLSFNPNVLHVSVNRPVELTIQSDGTHTFTINELGINAPLSQGSNVVTFTPTQTGTSTFYCAIPGHREAGMQGTLVVSQ